MPKLNRKLLVELLCAAFLFVAPRPSQEVPSPPAAPVPPLLVTAKKVFISNVGADPLPMFRLVILDRKTHYVLWALTESVEAAALQKTHDRNFDNALTALVSDLKRLTAIATPATP